MSEEIQKIMQPIGIKIHVNLIQKERLFVGKTNTSLDAVMIPTPDNKYGDDFMIVQSVSKEERLAGVKGPIIGNAKILGGGGKSEEKAEPKKKDDKLPF